MEPSLVEDGSKGRAWAPRLTLQSSGVTQRFA
jgi:hypothetical protein